MKKFLLFTLSLLLSCVFLKAQTVQTKAIKRCGTMENLQREIAKDPTVKTRMDQLEQFVENWVKNHPNYEPKTTITIPVVVHIIYNGSAENIPDSRVTDQIAATNADYAGANAHSMYSFSTTLKANTGVQFCLAKRDASGNATTGITRTSTTVADFSSLDYSERHTSTGGCDAWDPTKFFNIWVCDLGSGMCGYSQFPYASEGGGVNGTYGSAINYLYFGTTGSSPPFNLGGTLTHEAGHCLDLFHIWGDDSGGCTETSVGNGSDGCADTPNQADMTTGHHTGVLTDACTTTSPGIMYENFMDYSDDQDYANFTPNQVARIQALFAAGGPLVSLKNSLQCSGVGIDESELISNVNIYPNPSNGIVNVIFDMPAVDNVKIIVSNIVGDVVAKVDMYKVSSVNIPIDLSEQAAGVYYIMIQSQAGSLTRKISLFK